MSQETERYQLENNGNTYLVRTPASGGEGADVEANPEGTATEDLEKLKVGETIYGLPPVVGANPVLAGSEPDLTSLLIGDIKYKVPTPHTINTYTTGILSADDQAKIAEDIVNHYPIIVANNTYILTSVNNYRAYFMCNRTDHSFNGSFESTDYSLLEYNFSTHSLGATSPQNILPIRRQSFNYNETIGSLLTYLNINGQDRVFGAMSTYALTTAPTADNTDGGIRLVVLTAEPATYYNGYYYIIAPST